jgi:phosphohistidine phosphatase
MKKVVVVRHAKSEPYGYDNDFNRDLTERGVSDAEKISEKLRSLEIKPDLVISSSATRALHTATLFGQTLGYEPATIRKEEILYSGITTQGFIDMLHDLPETVETVFIFGHNPTVYYLVYNLVKYFNSDMPTCSTVVLNFPVEKWTDVSARGGVVAVQLTPKSEKNK